jgi:type VII secretion protein EccE
VPAPDSDDIEYGVRWDGQCLVTMLRVDRVGITPTLLSSQTMETTDPLPLPEVARCLSQFDIRLAAIDVIISGVRTPEAGTTSQTYRRLLGELPATATRTAWLALRLDPVRNAKAIHGRGGGLEGSLRATTVATRRVANRLATGGVQVRVLTAAEMRAATHALAGRSAPEKLTEDRDAMRHNGIALSSYEVLPHRLSPEALTGIWAASGNATTLVMRLRPAGADPRRRGGAAGVEPVLVSTMVRVDGPDERARAVGKELTGTGLQLLAGMQRRALLTGLAMAPITADPSGSAHLSSPEALRDLVIPVSGCGQVVGATDDGRAAAVPLFGHLVRQVEIIGDLSFIQRNLVRSIALGAKVMVHTRWPHAWAPLVARIGAPEQLSLSLSDAGGPRAAHAAAATVLVYDGVEPTGYESAMVTVVCIQPRGGEPRRPEADVTLIQSVTEPDRAAVRTATGTINVRNVAIPEEFEYVAAER